MAKAELADKLLEGVTSAEDPLRAMADRIADFMVEAEVTAKIGAEAHERSAERTTYRNGFRDRRWDTRLGTLALKMPKLVVSDAHGGLKAAVRKVFQGRVATL